MKKAIRNRLSSSANDSGEAVVVMVLVLSVLLIGVLALAVDLGTAYASKRELSVTADGAALAGAREVGIELREQFPAGTACSPAVANALNDEAAAAAIEVYRTEEPRGSDGDPAVTVSCAGENFNVTVVDSATHSTRFARLLNPSNTELKPAARAVAQVSGSEAYSGLRPYAVCVDQVTAAQAALGTTVQSAYDVRNGSISCGPTPPGNWGLVDFDGGNNDAGDVTDWTRDGYYGAVSIPDPAMPGNPGAKFDRAATQDALTSIVGQVVLLPVATQWQEAGGNNANFAVPGLLSAEICGWEISRNKKFHGDCWDSGQAASAPSGTDLILQWRYAGYATSYSGASAGNECSLADALCVPTVRLYE